MSLLKKLAMYIESGEEAPKVELKREIDISSRSGAARFAKEVMAIANTQGYNGYIIIGVIDRKNRQSDDPKHFVPGFESKNPDELQRRMNEILSTYSDPVPEIRYEEIEYPPADKKLGIVIIPYSRNRPHFVAREGENLHLGEVWLRRGSAILRATRSDQEKMRREAKTSPLVIINFSHPLTDIQHARIEELTQTHVEETIDVPVQFNDQESFEPQVKKLVEEVRFTSEEWQTTPLLIIPPEFSPIACALLAYLHGMMGYFPKILRRRPLARGGPFEAAEVIDLRLVRETGRAER